MGHRDNLLLARDQTKSKRSKRSESVPAKPPRYRVNQNRPKMPIPAKRTSIPSYDSESDDSDSDDGESDDSNDDDSDSDDTW